MILTKSPGFLRRRIGRASDRVFGGSTKREVANERDPKLPPDLLRARRLVKFTDKFVQLTAPRESASKPTSPLASAHSLNSSHSSGMTSRCASERLNRHFGEQIPDASLRVVTVKQSCGRRKPSTSRVAIQPFTNCQQTCTERDQADAVTVVAPDR
jgi:hypothetical protein